MYHNTTSEPQGAVASNYSWETSYPARVSNPEGKNKNAELIYQCLIQHGKMTMKEIQERTGLPINVVTGRCNDLRSAGRIIYGKGHEKAIYNSRTPMYVVKIQSGQVKMFK